MDVSIEPALAYVLKVKSILNDDHSYRLFIQVCLDFKGKRNKYSVVDETLKKIFKHHKDLMMGFNAFLPDFHKIPFDVYDDDDDDDVEETQIPTEYEFCIGLFNKVKVHFQRDGHDQRFEAFLNVIDMCSKGSMDLDDACDEIKLLLEDNHDVLYEILKFLLGHKVDDILRTRQLSYPDAVSGGGRLLETGTKKRKHPEKDEGTCIPSTSTLGLVETRRKKGKDVGEDNHGCNTTEILITRISSHVDDREELMEAGLERIRDAENSCSKTSNFLGKVEQQLGNIGDYLEFLKLIKMYRCGNINRYELEIWVEELFHRDAGLFEEFQSFVSSFDDDKL